MPVSSSSRTNPRILGRRAAGIRSKQGDERRRRQDRAPRHAGREAETAPLVVCRVDTRAGANRVQVDVPRSRSKLHLAVHEGGPEPPVEDMAREAVAPVEDSRIRRVEPVHSKREVWIFGLEKPVHVARQQAERVTSPAKASQREPEKAKHERSVAIGDEELELPDGAAADVIDAAGNEETRLPAHSPSVGAARARSVPGTVKEALRTAHRCEARILELLQRGGRLPQAVEAEGLVHSGALRNRHSA
jgi:hypothetical protein